MGKLSLKKYGLRFSLGAVAFYFICLSYGSFLSDRGRELHRAFFELIPGFTWGNAVSVIWGAIYFFIIGWLLAWFIVWVHNSSLEGDSSEQPQKPVEKQGYGSSCCR